ncbi:MAG: hypothetical protein RR323_06170 [Raoultibacter sp.]
MRKIEDIIKFAKSNGYEDVSPLGEWNGYEAFEPLYFSDGSTAITGPPLMILAKGETIRMSTPEEAYEQIDMSASNINGGKRGIPEQEASGVIDCTFQKATD